MIISLSETVYRLNKNNLKIIHSYLYLLHLNL